MGDSKKTIVSPHPFRFQGGMGNRLPEFRCVHAANNMERLVRQDQIGQLPLNWLQTNLARRAAKLHEAWVLSSFDAISSMH